MRVFVRTVAAAHFTLGVASVAGVVPVTLSGETELWVMAALIVIRVAVAEISDATITAVREVRRLWRKWRR